VLPRWVIFKKSLCGGHRLAKKPVFETPRVLSAFARPNGGKEPLVQVKTLVGWDNWEYRFWAADVNEGSCVVCECRACGSMFGGQPGRSLHLANFGCAKKLVAAYKLLLKDRRCVICNEKTGNASWGVPLCTDACVNKWKHEESQPAPLVAALHLVGDG
jgi:hypothetical protein